MFCLYDSKEPDLELKVELLAGAPTSSTYFFVHQLDMDANLVVDFACTRHGTVYITKDEPSDQSANSNGIKADGVTHFYKKATGDSIMSLG